MWTKCHNTPNMWPMLGGQPDSVSDCGLNLRTLITFVLCEKEVHLDSMVSATQREGVWSHAQAVRRLKDILYLRSN